MWRVVVMVWAGIGFGATIPAAAAAQTAGLKIAFIHSRAILEQTPGYAAADSTLRKEGQALQDTLQRMQQQWDSATRVFEQQSIALSSGAKQAKQRELQQMQQRLQQRQTEMQTRYQQREQELLQPIQARVLGIVQGIRAEGNYALIFDMDAPNNAILTADPSLEVTGKVLERLKQSQ